LREGEGAPKGRGEGTTARLSARKLTALSEEKLWSFSERSERAS